MKLFGMFNISQEEILNLVIKKISAKTSAVWIAENVENVGLLEKSDMIFAFFEGSLMMVSERYRRRKLKSHEDKQIHDFMISFENIVDGDLATTFTATKEYYEIVAYKKGWYDWLNSN